MLELCCEKVNAIGLITVFIKKNSIRDVLQDVYIEWQNLHKKVEQIDFKTDVKIGKNITNCLQVFKVF